MKHGFSDAACIKWLNDNLEDRSAVEGLLGEMRADMDNSYSDIRDVIFAYAHDAEHRPLAEVPDCDFDINIVTGLQRELQSTKDLLATACARQRNVDAKLIRAHKEDDIECIPTDLLFEDLAREIETG